MIFGKKLRQIRLEKELKQEDVADKLGFKSNSYISDVESGKFIPADDKLSVWAEALGMSWEDMEDLRLETKIEELGISDPAFTMMFKEVPSMTAEEKKSIVRAFEAVLKARQAKGQHKTKP